MQTVFCTRKGMDRERDSCERPTADACRLRPAYPLLLQKTKAAKGRVFKIELSKVSGSALAAEICTGPHNRLLRRQHCSSLCSQSEGHEHVANMTSALGHDFIGFSTRAWPPQYSLPSLCEQSELQCFAPGLRQMSARWPLHCCPLQGQRAPQPSPRAP